MAQSANLQAAVRRDTGKGAARSLRREGKVPAVIYGHHREPEALVLDAPAVGRLLKGGHASTTMIELAIDGRAAVKAMLREVQRNPVKQHEILHVDLYEVTANEPSRWSATSRSSRRSATTPATPARCCPGPAPSSSPSSCPSSGRPAMARPRRIRRLAAS
jgi:large subunit ribosomal protein L25